MGRVFERGGGVEEPVAFGGDDCFDFGEGERSSGWGKTELGADDVLFVGFSTNKLGVGRALGGVVDAAGVVDAERGGKDAGGERGGLEVLGVGDGSGRRGVGEEEGGGSGFLRGDVGGCLGFEEVTVA